jgi:hypothetical protein
LTFNYKIDESKKMLFTKSRIKGYGIITLIFGFLFSIVA